MRIEVRTGGSAAPSVVVVTNHAVLRYAERVDGLEDMPPSHLHDGEAVAELERRGYPVAAVRRHLARSAEPATLVGAKSVNVGKFSLVLVGNTVVTCAPRGQSRLRRHPERETRRGRRPGGYDHHAEW